MIDTGMNRLGLRIEDVRGGALGGLVIETLLSHLASADEFSAQNERQGAAFAAVRAAVPARRASLSNSAAVCLGAAYGFDLTRPGLALYGGVPRREAEGPRRPAAFPEQRVLQGRALPDGGLGGDSPAWTAPRGRGGAPALRTAPACVLAPVMALT